jgi:hypothetical protein
MGGQRVAVGRTMDTRLKLLSKAMSKTLQGLGAVVGAAEGSPIFPGSRVNFLTFSVVLGLETERALEMHLPNLALMPHRTLLPNLRMTADRIGPFHLSPVQTNLRPTRLLTHHPMRQTTLGRPEEIINLPTIHLRTVRVQRWNWRIW